MTRLYARPARWWNGNASVRQVTAAFSPGRAAGDPLTLKLILPRVFGKTSAAAVIDLARRLQKQEAAINIDRVQSPSQGVSRQRDMIFSRVIPKKGQPKAVLALKRTVTRPGVTTHPA